MTAPRLLRSPLTSTRRHADPAAHEDIALILDTGPIVALLDAGVDDIAAGAYRLTLFPE